MSRFRIPEKQKDPIAEISQAAFGAPPAAPAAPAAPASGFGAAPAAAAAPSYGFAGPPPGAAAPAAAPLTIFSTPAVNPFTGYPADPPPPDPPDAALPRQTTVGFNTTYTRQAARYGKPIPRVHASDGCYSNFNRLADVLNAYLSDSRRYREVDELLRRCISQRTLDVNSFAEPDPRSMDYHHQLRIKNDHIDIINTLIQLHTFIGQNIGKIYMIVEFHGVTKWVVVCYESGPSPRHEQIRTEVMINKTGAYRIRDGGRYRKRRKTVHKKNKNKKRKTRKH